jgi:hypothetical protein
VPGVGALNASKSSVSGFSRDSGSARLVVSARTAFVHPKHIIRSPEPSPEQSPPAGCPDRFSER